MDKSRENSAPPCPICGSERVADDSTHRDRRKGLPGSWHYMRCAQCDVTFVHPLPSHEEISGYYKAYYRQDNTERPPATGVGFGTRFPALRVLYHRLSGDVDPRDFVSVRPGYRMLDYGCGGGTYLHYFRANGADISGAEISQSMAEHCRRSGLDVRDVTNINIIPFGDEKFDIVYLMQVLEHIRDPHEFFTELHRVLKSGGTLYLALPNGQSFWRKLLGANWLSGWFSPFHLYVYDAKTLTFLADEHGFAVSKAWSRTPESWFRLNLAAVMGGDKKIATANGYLLGAPIVRPLLMILLRAIEMFVREKDCLVVTLEKRA